MMTLMFALLAGFSYSVLCANKGHGRLDAYTTSAYEFAETFASDLEWISRTSWKLERVDRISKCGKDIYLGKSAGSASKLIYQNGEVTEEAYELEVQNDRTGALGMWWGTRTLLQQLVLSGEDRLMVGRIEDASAYSPRVICLTAVANWYSLLFLKETCTFASFFKCPSFDIILWTTIHLTMALMRLGTGPEDPELNPLVERRNETLSRREFEDLQRHCVSRGVTVIPEIEAPGHALVITRWKPEFINFTAGKAVRIWGTYEPAEHLSIDKKLPSFNTGSITNPTHRENWQWVPSLIDPYNIEEQLDSKSKGLKGATMAAWNDNGYDASTQLEAYYTMKMGIPLLASRSWSGSRGVKLDEAGSTESLWILSDMAPAQSSERWLAVEMNGIDLPDSLVSWKRSDFDQKKGPLIMGLGSKGIDYPLMLDVTGPFTLSSSDSILLLDDSGSLCFLANGISYPLCHVDERDGFDPGHPGRIWINASSSSHEPVKVPLNASITIKTDILSGSLI
ncbi:hypothetical protein CIHG_08674 [Coccidioides immitis H538.4]|uniref:beta-N-acetylhexosaminidase n=1 Tax=Coccidioides immitis H538.4 TaxID=396776 RepID=A0A0J8S302_COCIT|nr:hypothetical protein CIHG_08674 [Coccidioides immitis H538.4]